MLNPVTSLPLHPVFPIPKLVPELHRNAIIAVVGKKFLPETVGVFARPFLGEEVPDSLCAGEEAVAVTPDGVSGVGR